MTNEACDDYTRPMGVMGGTCNRCGRSQPEHAQRVTRQSEITEVKPLDLPAAAEAVRHIVEAERQAERWPDSTIQPGPAPRRKANHIGAPACFELELACKHLREAFGGFGVYQVGSSLDRADWRDVDLRMILPDDEFAALFPNAGPSGQWEQDPRWLVMTVAIAAWLKEMTGLPIDFQFQPQGHANERHPGPRNALGLRISRPQPTAELPQPSPSASREAEITGGS